MTQERFILEVLRLFAKHELHSELWWSVEEDAVKFLVNCNDLFFWATADAEEITPENLSVLRQAIEDCKVADPIGGVDQGPSLFACRIRGIRPQQPSYPKEPALRALFDAAGPERKREEEG